MNRGIRVALWGFGHMNKIILSMLIEKGYQVVSVIGNHNHGQDAGVIAQISQGKLGVLITPRDQVAQEFKKTRPQVVILATKSYLSDIQAELRKCAELGINVITIAQEAFYSWNTQPVLTGELDSLFRKNNTVYTGSGFQDVYWGQLPTLLVTTAHKVKKMVITTSYNVDDYGQALCEAHGVGLIQQDFNKKFEKAKPTYVFMSNQWIARKLNKKIFETKQQIIPIILEKDIQSKSYGQLKAGKALGLKSIVTTFTEDVIIETQMMGYVFYDDHTDVLKVKLQGQPEIEVDIKQPTPITTCCSAIFRIPQVVNSIKKGYVPTYEL